MNRTRMTIQFSTCVLFSILMVILLPNLATAGIITSGDVEPPYPGMPFPDPWKIYADLFIGYTADGSVEITNGSEVIIDATIYDSYIGFNPTASGIVTVTGANSHLYNKGYLYVGCQGEGKMIISDGGSASTDFDVFIARDPNSIGTVTVTGANSHWENSDDLYVGYQGEGKMIISEGGSASTDSDVFIAHDPNSIGTVTVTGQDSLWDNSGDLYVGYQGEGEMVISDGGSVSSPGGFIAYDPNSRGRVTVTRANSHWENSDDLYVGYQGEGEMVISENGSVSGTWGFIAYDPNSRGTVTVTGANSSWINTHGLYVGYQGEGEMLISDGGWISSPDGFIAYDPNSRGRVTVTGQDSHWENPDDLYVGWQGEGEMVISDGGSVSNAWGCIAYDPNSRGTVTVTGQNSRWNNTHGLYVGYQGEGEMVISEGGYVSDTWGCIAYDPNSRGRVTVTGQGSLWQNSEDIYVGGDINHPGRTGLLNVNNGGTVEASSVVIGPAGTLSGDGLVSVSGSVSNYGTIKPGNSIGTLTIDGDLTIGDEDYPGSIYEVEVDNSGNSDLLSVTGDVNIVEGTVKAVSTESISNSQQYTIIDAKDVIGIFDTLDTSLLKIGMLWPEVSVGYGTDSVILQIDGTRFDDPSIVQTDNQSSLGMALQRIADGGGNSITTALQNLKNNGQVRGAYDQLCGQTRPQLAPVSTADASKFMSIVSDRLNYAGMGLSYYGFGNGPLLAMAEPDITGENTIMYDTNPNFALSGGGGTTSFSDPEWWGIWGRGYGVFGDRKSESGVPGYDYTVYGTSFGLDYQITDTTLLGVTAGYSDGNVDFSLAGNDSDISGIHIGIYGNKNMGDWNFDSILTYSFLEYETKRIVDLTSEQLKGDTDGQGISGYLEARYDWRDLYSSWLLQPLASFQISYLDLDGYTESGGVSSLEYDDQSYNSYMGSLGMKASKELFAGYDGRSVHVQLRGRWLHEFGDNSSSVNANFASDPGAVFKVSDKDIARDSAVLGAGLNAYLSRYMRLSLGYDAQLNSDDTMHVLSAMLLYRW